MEYTDQNVPIECSECSELIEGVLPMVDHILENHQNYSPEEAANFARVWADSAYEQMELEDIERAEYFSRHREDFFEPESDKDYGD